MNITSTTYSSFIDLTCLDLQASEQDIFNLCELARQKQVAAVCIYDSWLDTAKHCLKESEVFLATVANFPTGDADVPYQLEEIEKILTFNPDEIDWVFPYKIFIDGEEKKALRIADKIRELIPENKVFKVILETGAFSQLSTLKSLCFSLIDLQVNFLKTSTGKIAEGYTLQKSEVLLNCIAERKVQEKMGFKASGGIRSIEQINEIISLVEKICGKNYLSAKTFRLGMSRLF